MKTPELPVDQYLGSIDRALSESRALVLIAEPGAGKSTRVPPHLATTGRTLLLQPRRVAARSIARRIAFERGWALGREVGWHIRGDRRESSETRLLVATEGILTARLLGDPFASELSTIILDEFHERSIHADLAIALAREAWRARDDLRLVVMSATLDAGPVARYLGDAPVIEVPGRMYPVEISHAPDGSIAEVLRAEMPRSSGHVLVFLAGAGEIERSRSELISSRVVPADALFRLHGSLDAIEQDRALAPSPQRKVILATNVAETSLTIDDVDLVVDSGQQKTLRFDSERGIDRLVVERIPSDAAAQRSGRAGRTRAGRAVRMWDPRLILQPHRDPDIRRVDLAAPVLDIYAWGGEPGSFEWFETPDPARLDAAMELLRRLGFVEDERITSEGRRARSMPAHPRIARFLMAAGGGPRALRIAAALSEGARLQGGQPAGLSDLFALEDQTRGDRRIDAVMNELKRGGESTASSTPETDERLLRAVLAAWPDRAARRRPALRDRYQLMSGAGGVLARESTVRDSEWIVTPDLGSVIVEGAPSALIRLASHIEPGWLEPDSVRVVTEESDDALAAWEESRYGELILRRRRAHPDEEDERAWRIERLRRTTDPRFEQLTRRLRFAGIAIDPLALAVESGVTDADALETMLPFETRRQLGALAPRKIAVPSGRERPLNYRDDGGVEMEVKLQELFGLTETPRLGPERVPLTIMMLAPNGRPVQTTRDLHSFWSSTYFEVRKELRGRYPKHPWPENPLEAEPTARTTRKPR